MGGKKLFILFPRDAESAKEKPGRRIEIMANARRFKHRKKGARMQSEKKLRKKRKNALRGRWRPARARVHRSLAAGDSFFSGMTIDRRADDRVTHLLFV